MKYPTKFIVAFLIVCTLGMPLTTRAQGRSELALAALATAQHMPDELIVQYRAGVPETSKTQARGRIEATFEELLVNAGGRADGKGDLELVRLPPGIGIASAVRRLAADPAVEFAEPNWIYHHTADLNDPYYKNGSLWGMYSNVSTPANSYGSQAANAWTANHTGSKDVYVGVIDEGIQYAHEDLAANMWENPDEFPNNNDKTDGDGNGYVDDVRGWDFDGNNNTTYDGTQDDHGTHVAGTIGAVGGNNKGVAGVSWNVKIISAKFLGRRGGTTANAIKAVDYLIDLKRFHAINLVAINNSWGGGGYSDGLHQAIERANKADILFIAAAGNGGSDGVGDNNDGSAKHYPSSYDNDNVIAVASITASGALSSFSNYGATSVDLGAPGSGIYSTLPNSTGNKYGSYSGTSMATPHVTGACALYAATHPDDPYDLPGAYAAQIKAAILESVETTTALTGKCVSGGRLDVSGF